ncbi:MAG: ThuA domain-containing protein [Halioglobus sp.]|nr:ThuA domain-containing protein [Halioglobus sp.]
MSVEQYRLPDAPHDGGRSAQPACARSVMLLAALLLLCLSGCGRGGELVQHFVAQSGEPRARVLFIAGRDSHGPWAHEHREGSLLLAQALHREHPEFDIQVVYGGWPLDAARLQNLDSVVFYCDGGPGHPVNAHLERFEQLLEDGVGVAALHYAVEVPPAGFAASLMQHAIGGYFETHWSVNPHWTAHFEALPEHPITRGVAPFTLRDEWYFNMRFVPGRAGVVPLLSAVPPPETMQRDNGPHSGNDAVRQLVADGVPQIVAWAYERPGGGRGFGYTGGHFHANWENENTLRLVVNAIAWTAQAPP